MTGRCPRAKHSQATLRPHAPTSGIPTVGGALPSYVDFVYICAYICAEQSRLSRVKLPMLLGPVVHTDEVNAR
jgi:hypothetical protein